MSMREVVKQAFKSNPLTSALLAVLFVGLLLVATQGYLSRHENWQRDYSLCKTTAANRWESAQSNRKDAEREIVLSAKTTGLVSALHKQSALKHSELAQVLEESSASTSKLQISYCKRINPEPGILD